MNKVALASLIALSGALGIAQADVSSYDNFYVTYMSPTAVQSAVKYAESQGVSRFFMWTVDQDAPATSANSLIAAINKADPNADVVTYFPNYASYNNQRAIPGASYTIAGNAADLDPKLNASNELVYAFAETQVPTSADSKDFFANTPNSYGAVYLFDPWSDLAPGDAFCGNSGLPQGVPVDANGYNLICAYAFDNKSGSSVYKNDANYNNFGNFSAFAKLPETVKGKDGQPIKTSLSIGGYGHNASFEAIFDPSAYGVTSVTSEQATANFVNSVVALLTHYNIDGVDLDYENVQMTPAQSQDYLKLVTALNTALAPLNKTITIAIISNPQYISGTESNGTVGFAPGVLKQIAALSQVKAVDAMTYDFSGTFNYGGASNPGTTGFLSNVYPPNDSNAPAGYNFSIQNAVQALVEAGVPASKIGVGIPAYGRALASLPGPAGEDGSYLFSPLSSSVVIPAGDGDNAGCTQDITQWNTANACQGMFSYNYIMDHIVGSSGVEATDHTDDSGNAVNGTTAFASTWAPAAPAAYTLTVDNKNAASGQVAVGGFSTDGYVPTGTKTYSPSTTPSTSGIEGQSGLAITFTYWKGTVQCGTADFTGNMTVTISDAAVPTCSATVSK